MGYSMKPIARQGKTVSRWGIASAIALAVAVAIQPLTLQAQATLQESGTDSGTSIEATEPVIVVTLGSVSKLMSDAQYMTGVVGQAEAGGMFSMMAGMFTQGIDPTQPIGIMVPLVNGAPEPIVLVPTADVKSVLKRLEGQTGPIDELSDGTLALLINNKPIYIRQNENTAVVAQSRELLSLAPADTTELYAGMGNAYDLALRLKVQLIPEQLRDGLIQQIRQGLEAGMAQQGDATDESREAAESQINQIEQLAEEADELFFGINIDSTAKEVVIDGAFTAVEGSKYAMMYGAMQPIPSRFASVIDDDAAAYFHSCATVSPLLADQTRASLQATLQSVEGMIANSGDLPPEQVADLMGMINRVADLSINSMAEGKSDGGAVLYADKGEMQFVLGGFVSDGNEAEQILRDLAEKVKDAGDAPAFAFDRGTYNGVTMHMVSADVPEGEDEARKILGPELKLHIGTGPKAIYVALGDQSVPTLKALIDAGDKDTASDRPLGQLKLKMLPILRYAQSIEDSDAVAAMISSLLTGNDEGVVSSVSTGVDRGQKFHMTISEGIFKAVGAAIKAEQQSRMGGEF